jgi:hypothetical protein
MKTRNINCCYFDVSTQQKMIGENFLSADSNEIMLRRLFKECKQTLSGIAQLIRGVTMKIAEINS